MLTDDALTFARKKHCVFADDIAAPHRGKPDLLGIAGADLADALS